MAKTARYAIGIDLGTTNCSLGFVDLHASQPTIELLPVPQWEGEGQWMESVKLPSFVWFLSRAQIKQQARRLPWQASAAETRYVLGREARLRASEEPERVAYAAKSWLSVGAMSTRQASILPWGSSQLVGEERLSPLAVQVLLLEHLRDAWNVRFAAGDDPQPFHQQKIVITVPASFDDLAQNLTLEAAKRAGYPETVELLEEPQAAFYDWYADHAAGTEGTVLVCDMGGGTSDFTLLDVGSDGTITRRRVSDHLLLGGDNIDLAIASALQEKMLPSSGDSLPRAAWQLLVAQARQLKEDVLQRAATVRSFAELAQTPWSQEDIHVSVPLQAQNLFGDYARGTIAARDLIELIFQGFFPSVDASARPERSSTGLRQFGLPFVQDTAVTRHLAAFLNATPIDAVLCAGGSLQARFLQERLIEVIGSWQGSRPIIRLDHAAPDLAIARGAAWYAWQRHHGKTLVASTFPRSLYLELSAPSGDSRYLCLVPRGQPRGLLARLEQEGLYLRTGQPVSFQLYSSLDAPQEVSAPLPEWRALPALTLQLPSRAKAAARLVPVALEAQVRETGVLAIAARSLEDAAESWRLDFSLEPAERSDGESSRLVESFGLEVSKTALDQALDLLQRNFGKTIAPGEGRIEQLPRGLEERLGIAREDWSLPLLRRLWEPLQEAMHRRQRSPAMESTWLYLAGFTLRPGWGAPSDPERMRLITPLFDHGLNKAHLGDSRLENQWWLFWRRVSGGLDSRQQAKILDRLLPSLRKDPKASAEMIRLAAALERAPLEKKVQAGRLFAQQIASGQKDMLDARIWALARISSRYPLIAGPEAIVPPHFVEEWADTIRSLPVSTRHYQPLKLFYQLAGRRRGESALDIDPRYREHFAERLKQAGADEAVIASLFAVEERSSVLDQQLFGESLPLGFVLREPNS